jgi:hypothetical protein
MRGSVQDEPALGPERADGPTGETVESVDPGPLSVIREEDLLSVDTAAAAIEFDDLEEVSETPRMDLTHDLLGRRESQTIDLGARQTLQGRTCEDALQQFRTASISNGRICQ